MSEKMTIIHHSKTDYCLVYDEIATEALQYAGSELRDYLFAMTAVQVPLASESPAPKKIVITHGQQCEEYGFHHWKDLLGADGYYLNTIGDDLIIVGDKRGVIYGVYELLEKLGCRFFTSKCEKVPHMDTVEIQALDEWYTPPLEYREHLHQSSVDSIPYALKSRLNGGNTEIPEGLGGKVSYAWFCHTFDIICPPDDYYEEHPEYFSQVEAYNLKNEAIIQRLLNDLDQLDSIKAEMARRKLSTKKDLYVSKEIIDQLIGTAPDYLGEPKPYRLRDDTQLCLSNEKVLELAIDSVREKLRQHPEARIISVSQNDCGNPCQCPKCREIDEREGSHAGSIIHFVNKVAEAIEEEFPHVLVDTFAYLYSRNAPRYVKARHNVCVRLCSIECCFSHPFTDCDYSNDIVIPFGGKTNFVSDVKAWSEKCENLYIWDYTTNYAHYCVPFPNWKTLQPNAKFLVGSGVKGILEQGNYCKDYGTDLNELRAYLIGKILWNPETDVEKHMDEFIDYYYGKGAPYIKEYLDTMLKAVEDANVHCGFAFHPDKDYLTPDYLDQYDAIFNKALNAVKDNVIHSMRIHRAQLSLRYVRLKQQSMKGHIVKEEIDTFFEDCIAHGIVRVEEWVNLPKSRRAFFDKKWSGFEYLGDFRSQNDPNY